MTSIVWTPWMIMILKILYLMIKVFQTFCILFFIYIKFFLLGLRISSFLFMKVSYENKMQSFRNRLSIKFWQLTFKNIFFLSFCFVCPSKSLSLSLSRHQCLKFSEPVTAVGGKGYWELRKILSPKQLILNLLNKMLSVLYWNCFIARSS